ncbi:hypothetical protein IQ06DRAFT_303975 [Phaeosphaeriaceae sp. SRC1lsM3a]|nr:hypothetical protein IQ06DRAFT_303975 [Stagonospora sp. SRC1lsM3a]
MPDHQSSSSSNTKHPCAKDVPEQTNSVGSPDDIRNFLSQLSSREHTALPQNPWAVSEGSYTRPDGSVLETRGPDHFQEYARQSRTSESVQGLAGNEPGCRGEKN